MKLLTSHEDYINGQLEDLFLNELNLEKQLAQWMYRPFDNYNDWLKYGDMFIRCEMSKEEL